MVGEGGFYFERGPSFLDGGKTFPFLAIVGEETRVDDEVDGAVGDLGGGDGVLDVIGVGDGIFNLFKKNSIGRFIPSISVCHSLVLG